MLNNRLNTQLQQQNFKKNTCKGKNMVRRLANKMKRLAIKAFFL